MTSIECAGVTVRFGQREALRGVTLACAAGEWLTVLGPSAGGKTTLLRTIAGLIAPAEGEVRIGGILASNHSVRIAPHGRGIGFLFQKPSLWPHLSCRANVELGATGEKRASAQTWLERVGVGGLSGRFPHEISGGEARLVALARALAGRPRILLLDEPTAHLDLHLREGLMRLLREVHREMGMTAVCVTHQLEPPVAKEERVVVIEAGEVRFDGAIGKLGDAAESDYMKALERWIGKLICGEPMPDAKK